MNQAEQLESQGWCSRSGDRVEPVKKKDKSGRTKYSRPKLTRCPVCKRRVVPRTINCEPMGEFEAIFLLPPHKLPIKKRKK